MSDDQLEADTAVIDELTTRLGWQHWPGDSSIVLEVGDFEITRALAHRRGLHTVESTSRGTRTIEGTFSSARDARRFLVMALADLVRTESRMPDIRHPGIAPGMELEEGPTDYRLTWPGAEATFSVGLLGKMRATDFSWVAKAEVADIAASYRDLNGAPIFR
jgi:hypothetical protein